MESTQTPELEVVFDLAEVGYQHWGFGAFGLILIAIAVGLYFLGKSVMRDSHPLLSSTLPKAIIVIAVVFTLIAVLPTYVPYKRLADIVERGDVLIVEGVVENFVPAPFVQGPPERFTVDGVPFHYSTYVMSPGFHQTRAHGGPIDAGKYVRIAHKDGVIVRLEVER